MRARLLCLIGVFLLIAFVSTPSVAASHRDAGDHAALPSEASTDWWQAVQSNIQRSEYNITWQDKTLLSDVPTAFQAPNRAQNLRTYFTPQGIRVIPRTGDVTAWQWGLALTSCGYAERMLPVAAAELFHDANRMEYRRGDLVESYVNDSRGIEQGFTLEHPPSNGQSHTRGTLRLDMNLLGDLHAGLQRQGETLEFHTGQGAAVLNYGELRVYDASGRTLPASFALDGSRISIEVDDTEALYPITIDPLASTADWAVEGPEAGAALGFSVATAGDVNGDGYSDVVIGAPYYDGGYTDAGEALVFEGGSTGLSSTPAWTDGGTNNQELYGYSVSTAGDVNGDGYSDVIVGAPRYTHPEGSEGGAFVYYGSSAGLSSTPSWSYESDVANAWAGVSVATAGDVNGDGYSDVILGIRNLDTAMVWHGGSSGLGSPDNWDAYVPVGGVDCAVNTAGDVNGDGYSDVIFGVAGYHNGQTEEGAAFIWFGSSTGLGANGDATNYDWADESDVAYAHFGSEVATAGDVNGDGFADVIVGAHAYANGETAEGAAYVYYGSSSGPSATPDWFKESNVADLHFGRSVGTVGDLNGDGFADVVVGAANFEHNTPTNNTAGSSYVFLGAGTGLDMNYAWSHDPGLSEPRSAHGYSAATAGDVNGDGYSDLIIGMPGFSILSPSPPVNYAGRVGVYLGSADGVASAADWSEEGPSGSSNYGHSVSTAGDVNGDGFDDLIVGDDSFDGGAGANEGGAWLYLGSGGGPSTTADWSVSGGASDAGLGETVATAGDVNGDGYDDVIIGSSEWLVGSNNLGRVLVYHGSSTGLSVTADWLASGNQDLGHFGVSVATAGDVNGDGYSDVIVGASDYNDSYTAEGATFVWFGSSAGLGPINGIPGNADWWAVSEQSNAQLGASVATAGDVDGDGYSDVIAGAPGYSNSATSEGGAFVWHGSASLSGKSTVNSADWSAESNQSNANLGNSVATAGDVNGDGFADVIVGADHYDDAASNGGAAFVWHGSSSGLGANGTPGNADWHTYGGLVGARLGVCVACAGDVNGDGYADVVVGEPYLFPLSGEGAARAFYGSDAGLGDSEWYVVGPATGSHFGRSVATAGDVNSDGYADVVVGAPGYSGTSSTGLVQVFYGNGPRRGLNVNPRQRRSSRGPMARLDLCDSASEFRLRTFARTPFGRGLIKMEWEVKELGTLFDGTGTGQSSGWTDTGNTGVVMGDLISGLSASTVYHWRVRFLYHPSTIPFQPASRWFTRPVNGWEEADFRTPAASGTATPDEKPTPSTIDCTVSPNPFNGATTIRFHLPKRSQVTMEIFDFAGRLVTRLLDGELLAPGYHNALWNGTDEQGHSVSSGIYFFRLTSGEEAVTGKVLLLK